jgi:hypothetical protein
MTSPLFCAKPNGTAPGRSRPANSTSGCAAPKRAPGSTPGHPRFRRLSGLRRAGGIHPAGPPFGRNARRRESRRPGLGAHGADQRRLMDLANDVDLLARLAESAMIPADWAAYASRRRDIAALGPRVAAFAGAAVALCRIGRPLRRSAKKPSPATTRLVANTLRLSRVRARGPWPWWRGDSTPRGFWHGSGRRGFRGRGHAPV